MRSSLIGLAFLASLEAIPAFAQQPTPSLGIQAPVPPAVAQSDRRVTFRIHAPTATEVAVFLPSEQPNRHELHKGSDGIWSATVGPFSTGVYDYSFLIGGARVNTGKIEVPGETPQLYDVQNVPHGSVTAHTYFSQVQSRLRPMNVYLPPEYYTQPKRRFPVLYLFAGMSEEDWTRSSKAHVILDNLIAQRRAVPTIVVMPNNTTGPKPRPALENAAIMERELLGEIIPLIERTYRAQPGRSARGIAGVSFGGGTAFTIGMRHLDRFAWIAEFGTGAFGGGERTSYAPGYVDFNPDNIAPGLYAKLKAPATKPRLFFMTVGDSDTRAPFQRAAYEQFRANGADPLFKLYPGGHEWKVFRPSFEDFAQLVFKP